MAEMGAYNGEFYNDNIVAQQFITDYWKYVHNFDIATAVPIRTRTFKYPDRKPTLYRIYEEAADGTPIIEIPDGFEPGYDAILKRRYEEYKEERTNAIQRRGMDYINGTGNVAFEPARVFRAHWDSDPKDVIDSRFYKRGCFFERSAMSLSVVGCIYIYNIQLLYYWKHGRVERRIVLKSTKEDLLKLIRECAFDIRMNNNTTGQKSLLYFVKTYEVVMSPYTTVIDMSPVSPIFLPSKDAVEFDVDECSKPNRHYADDYYKIEEIFAHDYPKSVFA